MSGVVDSVADSQMASPGIGRARVIQGFAAFDLVVTGILALPVSAHLFVRFLYAANDWSLGVESASVVPEIPAVAWLFFNIAGVLGVLWALVRIAMPIRELALADAVGRFVVATLILYYYFGGAVPEVLFAFVATELLGTAVQLWLFVRPAGQATPPSQ